MIGIGIGVVIRYQVSLCGNLYIYPIEFSCHRPSVRQECQQRVCV